MLSVGEVVGDKYRVLRVLGHGGMGVVHEALHLATERRVALKCLHPDAARAADAAARLAREARATGRIHHPNVVAVHDCGEHAGRLYLVMERLRGSSLRTWARGRSLAPEEACGVLFPVLRGVAAAHAAGVLHRDLKPENVFMVASPDGLEPVPKVLDFGLARVRDEQTFATVSVAGTVMGTYQYMAPEQLRGQALDERADVYALGVIAHELLTGQLPYRADNPVDLALQILEAEPAPLEALVPGLSRALSSVVARALARDRDARFATVDDFAGALEAFAGGQAFRGSRASAGPGAASPPPLPRGPSDAGRPAPALSTPFPARSASKRRARVATWIVAAGGLAALGALAFGVVRQGEVEVGPSPVGATAPDAAPVAPPSPEPAGDWAVAPSGALPPDPPAAAPEAPPVQAAAPAPVATPESIPRGETRRARPRRHRPSPPRVGRDARAAEDAMRLEQF